MKVLITGAHGMVGNSVREHCISMGDDVLACDHQTLDISNRAVVQRTLEDEEPNVVINCAAWTDVDGCEGDKDRAFAANARGPENLAKACHEVNASFVTISTDYVFDGTKKGFYTQDDRPNPKSIYAISKLEGEHRAQSAYLRTVVVRAGFIFGLGGKNFLSTIVGRARAGGPIKAISDSFGTPTYAPELAIRLRYLAVGNFSGIFHVANAGDGVSYEQFAREALRLAGCVDVSVEGVAMDSLHRPAPRPRNSRLRCLYSEALGLPALPDWKYSLGQFVQQN